MATSRAPSADADMTLTARLAEQGIEAFLIRSEADLDSLNADVLPHLALLDMEAMPDADVTQCARRCAQLKLPVIALVPGERVADLDMTLHLSDFVVNPPNPDELLSRARKIAWRNQPQEGPDLVRVGDLVINPTSYEVSLKGRRVNLRFKEYELLRLLASNPGRVYTREALLSRIWGYDYIGGTRTVDVHIRRLRSKIEDADHSFVETIWNVGYRFKDLRGT